MQRGIRNAVLTVLAVGLLVGAFGAMGSTASGSNESATASKIDCSKLTGNDKQTCLINRCDSRGQGSPTCRKLEKQAGQSPTTPQGNCKAGTTPATVNGKSKCLKPGQKCSKKYKTDYAAAGFKCKGKKNKRTGKKVYKLKATGG